MSDDKPDRLPPWIPPSLTWLEAIPPTSRFVIHPRFGPALVDRTTDKLLPEDSGRDPRAPLKSYVEHADTSVRAEEKVFFSIWKGQRGVIATLPLWAKQLAAYHGWLNWAGWTDHGRAMIEACARVLLEPQTIGYEHLHAQARERKASAHEEGLARQTAWNERVAEQARERREREEAEREARKAEKQERKAQAEAERKAWIAARAIAAAAIEPTRAQWRPGLVPVIVWLEPADAARLRGAQ